MRPGTELTSARVEPYSLQSSSDARAGCSNENSLEFEVPMQEAPQADGHPYLSVAPPPAMPMPMQEAPQADDHLYVSAAPPPPPPDPHAPQQRRRGEMRLWELKERVPCEHCPGIAAEFLKRHCCDRCKTFGASYHNRWCPIWRTEPCPTCSGKNAHDSEHCCNYCFPPGGQNHSGRCPCRHLPP